MDLDAYRAYIGQSRGEFTVAKDQNVRLRSGWFSDRSASYLACGRPVVTQETGLQQRPADRRGAVRVLDDGGDRGGGRSGSTATTRGSRRAAARIARECFDYRVVLGAMLDHLGCKPAAPAEIER